MNSPEIDPFRRGGAPTPSEVTARPSEATAEVAPLDLDEIAPELLKLKPLILCEELRRPDGDMIDPEGVLRLTTLNSIPVQEVEYLLRFHETQAPYQGPFGLTQKEKRGDGPFLLEKIARDARTIRNAGLTPSDLTGPLRCIATLCQQHTIGDGDRFTYRGYRYTRRIPENTLRCGISPSPFESERRGLAGLPIKLLRDDSARQNTDANTSRRTVVIFEDKQGFNPDEVSFRFNTFHPGLMARFGVFPIPPRDIIDFFGLDKHSSQQPETPVPSQ